MKAITTILFIFFSTFLLAQGGALADLKFEEAETAFNNQNYETTIKKLDEFDKTYGEITAKSLYLRIACQNKLLTTDKIFESEEQFNLMLTLRKNVSLYIKAMENEELDDKFREVYNINEDLKIYPATTKEYKLALTQLEQAIIEDDYVKVQNSDCKYFKDTAKKVIYSWEGNCIDGFLSGNGILTGYFLGTNIEYCRTECNFSRGKEDGYCKSIWYNGDHFQGTTMNGKRNGHGNYYGSKWNYVGNWENDKFEGKGKLVNSKNETFEGLFKNGKPYTGHWTVTNSGQVIEELINGISN